MSNPAFDFFEDICIELKDQNESVLIDDEDFSPSTLAGLRMWFRDPATTSAVGKALEYLRKHFERRGSALPFTYDLQTGRVTAVHREYLDFVSDAQDHRSLATQSRDFEVATSQLLSTRLTGILSRVGAPRSRYRLRRQFVDYLVREFAFEQRVLVGHDQDGGFDILWFPPRGAFPFRAMVSIHCKNSPYNRAEGLTSVGRAKQTFLRHSYARAEECHLHCVIYNDYIDEKVMENARDAGFVPLGLSDLAPLNAPISLDQL